MTQPGPSPSRLHLSLGLLSVAVIAQQLVLMQILSITQWHHFAYLVISVALLGFGASGTVIALFRDRLLGCFERLLPTLMFLAGIGMTGSVALGQHLFGNFDSYLLFVDPGRAAGLLLTSLLFALPFFLAALAIGLIFVRDVDRIGTLYFANLLGSGLGGVVGIVLLELFLPAQLPAAAALFALAAGSAVLPRHGRKRYLALAAATALVAGLFLTRPPRLVLSQYKDLRTALDLPDAHVILRAPSARGRVDVVSAPALRHAPGLSLVYPGEVPVRDAVFTSGDWFGPVPGPPEAASLLDYTTRALPYALGDPDRVLVLRGGTAEEAAQALRRGAKRVVAVEPHAQILRILTERYPETAGALFARRELNISTVAPRTHLARDRRAYDLILLPTAGAFGGSAGLFALQEQNALTIEAVTEMLAHLAPEGLLTGTAWVDYPPRNPLRLAATLVAALEETGIGDPLRHIVAVRSWGMVTFCVRLTPFGEHEAARIRGFCRRLHFDPALLPGLEAEERTRHHRLQDPLLLTALDRIVAEDRRTLYADYPFRIRPPTDDRPFFSQFLKLSALPRMTELFGQRTVPFLEMGYLIVLLAFFQLAAAALILILLPLLRLGWKGGNQRGALFYFAGLGLGFMLVEMVLIHRFALYLGHPVHAAAAVISATLACSGAGSYLSSRLAPRLRRPHLAAALVAGLILLYLVLLPLVLNQTIALPLAGRLLVTFGLVALPAFLMGFPFPLGLRRLAHLNEPAVPWAWGINGCLSVVSTALADIIAVEAGFSAVFLAAAGAYGVAAAARL